MLRGIFVGSARFAKLAKETVQKLAVLRALTLWPRGAYGRVRLQKTMFAADKPNTRKLFTFKKYYLGQFSEQISTALNSLRASGRLILIDDGPAERLKAAVSPKMAIKIRAVFADGFPSWDKALHRAFLAWGYLPNNTLLKKAHEDASYTQTIHDQVIFESTIPDVIDIATLSENSAEELAEFVDDRLVSMLRERLMAAMKIPAKAIDWRKAYFEESPASKKAV